MTEILKFPNRPANDAADINAKELDGVEAGLRELGMMAGIPKHVIDWCADEVRVRLANLPLPTAILSKPLPEQFHGPQAREIADHIQQIIDEVEEAHANRRAALICVVMHLAVDLHVARFGTGQK